MFNKRVLFASIAVCVALFATTATLAKIHWLPDYLGDNLDKNNSSRSRDVDNKGKPSMWTPGGYDKTKDATSSEDASEEDELISSGDCPNGWFTETELEGKGRICIAKGSYPGIGICYGDCKCDKENKYIYYGTDCTGRYRCSGACVEGSTRYYREREDKCDTDYAKNPLISSCLSGMCDASGDLGANCPIKCAEKCCEYRDCAAEGFTPRECPVGSTCNYCTRGCGDDTVYSDVNGCDTGYEENSKGECVPSGCRSGYATKTAGCPVDPKVKTYTLSDTDTGGISGGEPCKKCIVSECNTGYKKDSTENTCKVDTSGYTEGGCPPNAECNTKTDEDGDEWYQIIGCKNGWQTLDTNCNTVTPCPNNTYPSAFSTPANAASVTQDGCISNYSGYEQCCKYKITCELGYNLNGNEYAHTSSCVSADCPKDSATSESACGTNAHGTYSLGDPTGSYSSGVECKTCKLTCNPGWQDSTCSAEKDCPNNSAINKNACGSIDNGYYELGSYNSSFSGDEQCRSCTIKCNEGYDLSGNNCVKDCSDYTLSSCPTNGDCSNCDTKFKLDSCINGYSKSGDSCTCSNGTEMRDLQTGNYICKPKGTVNESTCTYSDESDCTSSIPNAQSCTKDGNGCWQLNECQDGSYKNGSSCTACTWYGSSSLDKCPDHGDCSQIECGNIIKYSFGKCLDGYLISDDGKSCVADPCSSVTDAGCEYGYCASYYETCPSKCASCCDFSDFPISLQCPTYGSCTKKECGFYTRFRLDSCDEGFQIYNSGTLYACNCNPPNSKYKTYIECESPNICGEPWTCPNGDVYNILDGCEEGWKLATTGLSCSCDWTGYYATCGINSSCTSRECKGTTMYKLDYCLNTEYSCKAQTEGKCSFKLGGAADTAGCLECEKSGCAYGYMTSDECKSVEGGFSEWSEAEVCGDEICGKCTVNCYNEKTWQGSYCGTIACDEGEYQCDNTCCDCDWNGHTLDSCPANAAECTKEFCGGVRKYKVVACSDYWEGDTCAKPSPCPIPGWAAKDEDCPTGTSLGTYCKNGGQSGDDICCKCV